MSHDLTDVLDDAGNQFLDGFGEGQDSLQFPLWDDHGLSSYNHNLQDDSPEDGCYGIFNDFEFDPRLVTAEASSSNNSSNVSTPEPEFARDFHDRNALSYREHPNFPLDPALSDFQSDHIRSDEQRHGRSLTGSHTFGAAPSTTNINHHHAYPQPHPSLRGRTHQPPHRRSLSQSDADRIAALYSAHNTSRQSHYQPHQRARSQTPSEPTTRADRCPYPQARATRPQPGRTRSARPTDLHTTVVKQQHRGAASTRTHHPHPSNTAFPGAHSPIPYHRPAPEHTAENGLQIQVNRPVFRYMSAQQQMRDSARIIEIGAMAVLTRRVRSGYESERRMTPPREEVHGGRDLRAGEQDQGVVGPVLRAVAATSTRNSHTAKSTAESRIPGEQEEVVSPNLSNQPSPLQLATPTSIFRDPSEHSFFEYFEDREAGLEGGLQGGGVD